MDKALLDGRSFGSIFHEGMGKVFFDKHGNPGVLYTGALYRHAQDIVALNNNRHGFFAEHEEAMLKYGNFKYGVLQRTTEPERGPSRTFSVDETLLIKGPSLPEDQDQGIWAKTFMNDRVMQFNFHHVIQTAQQVKMHNSEGKWVPLPDADRVPFASWFSVALVLHEIMHHHGFVHPNEKSQISWKSGSPYASSLPHVAFWSVMRCSPYGHLVDQLSTQDYTFPLLGKDAGLVGIM